MNTFPRRGQVALTISLALLATGGLSAVTASADPQPTSGRRPEVASVTVSPTRDVARGTSVVEQQARRMPAAAMATAPRTITGSGRAAMSLARSLSGAFVRAGSLPVSFGPTATSGRGVTVVDAVALPPASTARLGAAAAFAVAPRSEARTRSAAVAVRVDYDQLAIGRGADWMSRARLVAYPNCAADRAPAAACLVGTPLITAADSKRRTLSATAVLASGAVIAASAGPSGTSGDFTATPLAASGQWAAGGNSGDFSWSYPIEVPTVAGGLGPDLALSYSSAAVDGLATSTNNQPSWVGEGWELSTGSIERQYKSCQDDMANGANNDRKTGDLCWGGQNATLAFGSHSGELVRDGSSRQWRLRDDDGTRVELLTAAWDNGDNDHEYWKVTTPDGTQYRFGLGRPHENGSATHSVWTVPVAGNHAGEPCHSSSFAASFCSQAWKWNLDSVIDVSGNSLTAFYTTETNRYGQNRNAKSVSYDRGGYLTKIEYGTRAGSEGETSAPAQVVFSTAERCVATKTEPCTKLVAKNNLAWPDVPQDQLCDSASSCTNRYSPTFFTRKRLVRVSTQIASGSGYAEVQRWSLDQYFPRPGDGTSAALWLRSITRSGAGGQSALPAMVFAGTQLASRVDGVEDTLGKSADPFIKWRVSGISSETGLELLIGYSAPDCTPKSLPKPETNTRRCFPVWFTPPGGVKPGRHWFHKYVVTKITEHDQTDSSPISLVHSYTYLGYPGWTFDDNPIVKGKYRTWSKWAGYSRVRTVTGNPKVATSLRTESIFYRGLDGDRAGTTGGQKKVSITDSEGVSVLDARRLAGLPREQITYNGISGPQVSGVITDQTVLRTTADNGSHRAELTGTTRARTRTALSSGAMRRTETLTSFDDAGFPTQVDDRGDVAVTTDDRCRRLSYARNESAWVMSATATDQVRTGSCAEWPSAPSEDSVVSDLRMSYDGLPFGQVSDGRLTKREVAARVDGDKIIHQVDSATSYDGLGRAVSVTDALGHTTRTAFSPTGAGLVVATGVTSPDPDGDGPLTPHVTSTTIDPRWGKPTKAVGPGGETTEASYDVYGRTLAVWEPGRGRTQTPSKKFSYLVSKTRASAVATQELTPAEGYTTFLELFDGLGRSRQTQTQQIGTSITKSGAVVPIDGRTILDTVYDDRGLAVDARGPIFAAGPPSSVLAAVPDTAVPRMTSTTYDGAGRATASTLKALGKAKWSTTTIYGGDRVTVIPPSGGTPTTTLSDARGRTTSVRQYLGGSASGTYLQSAYTYDAADRLAGFSDPAGNRWSYDYDLLGRRIKASDPDAGVTTKTYDALGQLTSSTDARHLTLGYTYDALGRRTALRDGDPAIGAVRASWSYDKIKKGYLDSAARHIGDQQIVTAVTKRDDAGRPLETSTSVPQIDGWVDAALAGTYTTKQDYLADGSPHTSQFPQLGPLPAEGVGYTYDRLGRPVAIGGNGAYIADTVYSGFGEMLQLVGGMHEVDTTWVTREYDEGTGRLVRNRFDRNAYPRADFDIRYSFSDGGTLTRIAASHPQSGATADNQCFGYDGLQRLTRAWTPASGDCAKAADTAALGGPAPYSRAWTYDAASNRTSQTDFTGTKTVTSWDRPAAGSPRPHGATSQTVTPAGAEPTTTRLSYDAAGNTVERSGTKLAVLGAPATAQEMTYNVENRLEKVVQGASTVSYAGDADGQKLLRRDATTTTLYLGDTELILDRTSGQLKANRYISLAGRTVAVVTGSGPHATSTLWSDLNNTASWQVDNDGSKITERLSMPFGEIRGAADSLLGTRGFVDGTNDTVANLVRVGARDYDPATGSFLSPDPVIDLNDPTQWNPYAYGNGNPLTRPDPTGTKPDWGNGGPPSGHTYQASLPFQAPQLLPEVRYYGSSDGHVVADRDTGDVTVRGVSFPARDRRGTFNDAFRAALRTEADLNRWRGPISPTPAVIALRYAINHCNLLKYCNEPDKFRDRLKLQSCEDGACNTSVEAIMVPASPSYNSVRRSGSGALACSFSGDTKVLVGKGVLRKISLLKPGSRVVSLDPDDGRITTSAVSKVLRHRDELLELHAGAETISTTRDHPFWSESDRVFKRADQLERGELLRLADGQFLKFHRLSNRSLAAAYNLELIGVHSYFVGQPGVLVHNTCGKPVNLPSQKTLDVDIEHILSGHTEGGSRTLGGTKDLFPSSMTSTQIEAAVRAAYSTAERVRTQGNQVLVRGTWDGGRIEMWIDVEARQVRTAYPTTR